MDETGNKSFGDEGVGRGRLGGGLMRIARLARDNSFAPAALGSVSARFNGTTTPSDYSITLRPRVNALLMSSANDVVRIAEGNTAITETARHPRPGESLSAPLPGV